MQSAPQFLVAHSVCNFLNWEVTTLEGEGFVPLSYFTITGEL